MIRAIAVPCLAFLVAACSASPMLSPSRGVVEAETMYRAIESTVGEFDLSGLSGKHVLQRFISLANTPGGVGWIGGYAPLRDASINFGHQTIGANGTRTNSGSGSATLTGPLSIPSLAQPSGAVANSEDIEQADALGLFSCSLLPSCPFGPLPILSALAAAAFLVASRIDHGRPAPAAAFGRHFHLLGRATCGRDRKSPQRRCLGIHVHGSRNKLHDRPLIHVSGGGCQRPQVTQLQPPESGTVQPRPQSSRMSGWQRQPRWPSSGPERQRAVSRHRQGRSWSGEDGCARPGRCLLWPAARYG
jgi:hypothetical protein